MKQLSLNKLLIALLSFALVICTALGVIGFADSTIKNVNAESEVATHTFFKARAQITGGSADWIWFSNNGSPSQAPTNLGSYKKVRIILAATKASIIREVLISLDDGTARFQYSNWNLELVEGKNVIDVELSNLTSPNSADLATHVPKAIEFLIHTDKAGATTQDVTYLTAGVQFVGDNDTNTDFDNIEYDPEMIATHTFFKNTKEISGGGTDWIWFHEGGSTVSNDKALGKYNKMRIILAATKAEMLSEVNVKISDNNSNNVVYNNNSLQLVEGKNIIELTLDKLTLNGVSNLSEFIPESMEFLVKTNKSGFTSSDKTKLTAGVQFVGISENDDFETIEYDPYQEPDVALLTEHTYLTESTKTITGGSSSWIGIENAANIVRSEYYMDKYTGIKIIIEGEKASMISQYNIVIGDTAGEYLQFNAWENFVAKNGKNEYLLAIDDMNRGGNVNLATFRPAKLELGVQTTNGTSADECEIKVSVVFVVPKKVADTDVKLLDFIYKPGSGLVYDSEKDTYTEDCNTIVGEFGPANGKDGASGGLKITVKSDAANGQMWLTTGGRWKDHRPSDVTVTDTLYFQDFGSFDLYFYVKDANYIENIMITMSSGENIYGTAPALKKIIGMVEQSGWQHLRFNLDSMNTVNNFDWDVKTEFVSMEFVVTVRAGTPVGEVLIFDDLYLRKAKCDPTISENSEFSKTSTTGTEINLANAVIAAHPFGDNISTSFGVKFAKTEDGTQQVITTSGGVFTPYRAGYYFVTATVTDAMGASARTEFTIIVTGDDVDMEEPSINFGSMPSYMAQPGVLDLSSITVTDDLDPNPTVVIKVTDANGKELTISDGKVNITVAGKYTVTVTATDAANHTKTLTRNVTVEGSSNSGDSGDTPAPTPEKTSGCNGAIGATSFVALGFIALATAKLRKKR